MPFNTIAEIENANQRAGQHWFEPATRRFFKSRILDGVHGGCFFVSSEKGPTGPRMYTVHYAIDRGSIRKASSFQAYGTATRAQTAARHFAVGRLMPADAWTRVIILLGNEHFIPQEDGSQFRKFQSAALEHDFELFYRHDVCRAVNIIHAVEEADMLLAEIARTADHMRRNG